MSRLLCAAAGAAAALVIIPQAASAHGLVGRADLPIPQWLFGWAASIVLIISFVALAVLWQTPRLEHAPVRRLMRLPVAVGVLCGAIGVALFTGLIYTGFAGVQTPTENALPTFVFVLFWVVLVPVSALLGDVFRAFNPWRAIGRAAAWTATRISAKPLPAPMEYPERLGHWPAFIGLLGFAWLELIATSGNDPSALATAALVYAAVQLIGMSLYGVERWTERGDAFAVYFAFFARLSPLGAHNGVIVLRRPLSGLVDVQCLPGTVLFLCVAIGITAFDGASEGQAWAAIAAGLHDAFLNIGFSARSALQLTLTVGLIAFVALVALVAGVYRIGVAGMHMLKPTATARDLGRTFAHSLVPIALVYVVAHYVSFAIFQGQASAYLISDPLGTGTDLFGTANYTIDYTVMSASAVWYTQVAALIAGHAAALALAHDRALVTFQGAREATRSQYWMLVVMIAFTSLGLWLLSSANQ